MEYITVFFVSMWNLIATIWPVILFVFLAAWFFRRGESIARYESKGEVLRAFGKHFVVVSSLSIAVVVGIFTALPYQSAAFYDPRFFIAVIVLLLGWLGYSIFLALSRRMIIFVCWVVFSFAFALLFLAAEEILLKEENEAAQEAAQLSTAETDAHFAFSYFENKETRPYPDWCGMIGTANELPESKQNCGFSRELFSEHTSNCEKIVRVGREIVEDIQIARSATSDQKRDPIYDADQLRRWKAVIDKCSVVLQKAGN